MTQVASGEAAHLLARPVDAESTIDHLELEIHNSYYYRHHVSMGHLF